MDTRTVEPLLTVNLFSLKMGGAGKRQFVMGSTITFFGITHKVLIHFIIAIGIIQKKDGISTRFTHLYRGKMFE